MLEGRAVEVGFKTFILYVWAFKISDTCVLFVCSTFADIFDESHFIKSLSQQVRVLRALPQNVMDQFENASMIYKISKVKAWSLPRFYLENALPELKERG
jgi:hypothetical protein